MTKHTIKSVLAFREDAIADGWASEPSYPSNEPELHAFKLRREGFIVMGLARPKDRLGLKWKPKVDDVGLHAWGPDGLAIDVADKYDWEALNAGIRRCGNCGKTDVETQRVSFAERCCEECLPAMRKKHEYPGWTG